MTGQHDNFSDLDFDWFAVDMDGRIAHFATGGRGFLPEALISDLQRSDTAFDTLFAGEKFTDAIIVEENLPNFNSIDQKNQYLVSFQNMARRGYFSFDVANTGAQNSSYVLVAMPMLPKTFCSSNCDDEQKASVPRFLNGRFNENQRQITYEDWVEGGGIHEDGYT